MFDPWVRKTTWSRKWQPIPVFFPRQERGARRAAVRGVTESDTAEQLNNNKICQEHWSVVFLL